MSHRKFAIGYALIVASICGLIGIVAYYTMPPEIAPAPFDVDNTPHVDVPAVVDAIGRVEVVEPFPTGYEPDAAGTKRFLDSLPKPTLSQAAPGLFGRGEDTPVLLYRSIYKACKAATGHDWKCSHQGIGDCVSHGWAHGVDIHLAVMWDLGDTGEWRASDTEGIYGGSRVEASGRKTAGYGDGSYGAAAAKFVSKWGVTFRQNYTDFGFDLSTYSASRAKDWGNFGNGGKDDSGKFDEEAKKHPVKNVALVRSFNEAAAAIASGYPVPVCSGQGFSSKRDKDGFSAPSGSWSHCMCFVAVRFDRRGLLCLNSWGQTWVGGPKWPDDQPDGSFWVDEKVCNRMLGGNDSFAVSGYEGFPYKDLKHGAWVQIERFDNEQHETIADHRQRDARDILCDLRPERRGGQLGDGQGWLGITGWQGLRLSSSAPAPRGRYAAGIRGGQ